MGKMTWAVLRDLVADRYLELRAQLTRRLGSEELASESLNETWLRLNRQDDAGSIQSPTGYVLRMALNIATERRRVESRRANQSELDAALKIPDPSPDPAERLDGAFQLKRLQQAIDGLPERTRDILIAARLQGLSQQAIADRYGITARMVRFELRRALDHCEACLEKNAPGRFLSDASKPSIEETLHPLSVSARAKRAGSE
jgi:RNA polymerase sigma factor (sigma-70 family)